ncbi:MAG: universal stress protein [Candidatus Aenigmatarchaeota archaeon]
MMKKLLVGVDGSSYSRSVEHFAIRFSKIFDAKITFMHIVDTMQVNEISKACENLAFDPFLNFNKELREACQLEMSALYKRGEQLLKEAQEISQKENVESEIILKTGIIPRVLEEDSCNYDIVFVGRKGINDEFIKDSLGINSDAFLRRTKIPMFVSPSEYYNIKNIIVAFDGKEPSIRSLEIAKLICEEQNDIKCEAIYVSSGKENDEIKFQSSYSVKNIVLEDGLNVGNAIKAYVESVENPLLVIGKSNKSEIMREILGSTTESILRQFPKFAILIVP